MALGNRNADPLSNPAEGETAPGGSEKCAEGRSNGTGHRRRPTYERVDPVGETHPRNREKFPLRSQNEKDSSIEPEFLNTPFSTIILHLNDFLNFILIVFI